MSSRLPTRRDSLSSDSSAVASSSARSAAFQVISGERRLVTAAFAEASGVRRSWLTAVSSAVRIRSASAIGRAASAAAASRCCSSATAAYAANAPSTRWSAAVSVRPTRARRRPLPAGTSTSAASGVVTASGPECATTVQVAAVPVGVSPPRSSSVTESMPNASRTRSSTASTASLPAQHAASRGRQ